MLMLVACSPFGNAAPGPLEPVATLPPTRGALSTLAATLPPPPPSATPDPAIVPEQFVAPSGVLAFRYPTGWTINDNSDSSELLVRAQSPEAVGVPGLFVVNVLNVEGPLTSDELAPLADSYLQDLFGEAYPNLPVSYRQEDEKLIATVVQDRDGQPVQYEVRFASRPPYYLVMVLVAAQADWGSVAPVLDTMARSVSLDATQGAALPTPTTAAVPVGEGLSVQNATLYEAATGSLYLVGEVVNGSAQPYEDIHVTVALLDGAGAELTRERWPIQRRLLPPSEKSSLFAIFSEPPEGWASFQTTVEALPANFYTGRITTAFEVSEVVASEPAFGDYALAGQLTNTGEDARLIDVTATLYDAEGRVLAIETASPVQEVLRAGVSAPWTLTFYSKAEGDVARYEVTVEGTRVAQE